MSRSAYVLFSSTRRPSVMKGRSPLNHMTYDFSLPGHQTNDIMFLRGN